MNDEYWLHSDDEQSGPFTLAQLQQMLRNGRITAKTLCWQHGFEEWYPLSTMNEVFEFRNRPAVSPVPKTPTRSQFARPGVLASITAITVVAMISLFWTLWIRPTKSVRPSSPNIGVVHESVVSPNPEASLTAPSSSERPAARAPVNSEKQKTTPQTASEGAFQELKRKAEASDPESQFALTMMLEKGEGVQKNAKEAYKWHRKAAEQGHSMAQFCLSRGYQFGWGLEQNREEAVKWSRRSAELGNPLGLSLWRSSTEKTIAPSELIEVLEKAASHGNAKAAFDLGAMHQLGRGVPVDRAAGFKWFEKAAKSGDVAAQACLGECYEKGFGIAVDSSQAVHWYAKAAEQGSCDAQVALGRMYAGDDIRDFSKAIACFRAAAEMGDTAGQYRLGIMYELGRGVPKDEVEALAWFNVAAISGDKEALKCRTTAEGDLNQQGRLIAQQRSKEILESIAEKSHSKSKGNSKQSPANALAEAGVKGIGTGAFVSADGYILTAAHVVRDSSAIKALSVNGLLVASIIAIDTNNDLAVLKCDGAFVPLKLGSSGQIRLGQAVFTIGFPNVQLQGFSPKVTKGEINSMKGLQDDPRQWQISVPVQPGNSGGPLLDMDGTLIGIVVSKLDAVKIARATGDLPQNVNYAVKLAYAQPLLDQITKNPSAKLSHSETPNFEDLVDRVRSSTVMLLVY